MFRNLFVIQAYIGMMSAEYSRVRTGRFALNRCLSGMWSYSANNNIQPMTTYRVLH